MEFTQGVRFDTLGLMPEMQRALEKKGISESTPIQAGCIPLMRAWKDVIAKAPTGTGKTFAFGIPIIEHIDASRGLTPTGKPGTVCRSSISRAAASSPPTARSRSTRTTSGMCRIGKKE